MWTFVLRNEVWFLVLLVFNDTFSTNRLYHIIDILHIPTYSRIQQQTKNPYYTTIHNEYTQENPRINRQDRQKITFPGSAYPKEISQQCTRATHTEAAHCQGIFLGVFHPCLWPLKAPGSTLGEGRQTSRQPADASTRN